MLTDSEVTKLRELQRQNQKRVRKHSRSRAAEKRDDVCFVCWAKHTKKEVHHVLPIRYGGSYGRYNLMAACKGKCHSLLNKLCNFWCRTHQHKFAHLTKLAQTRELIKWLTKRLDGRKTVQRLRETPDHPMED